MESGEDREGRRVGAPNPVFTSRLPVAGARIAPEFCNDPSSRLYGSRRRRGAFSMEAADFKQLCEKEGLTTEMALAKLVDLGRSYARPPISNFYVAAWAVGISGHLFLGVNLEFPGVPLHHSVHAEQFAVVNAFQNDEHGLRLIAVSAAPCGHCRQFLSELRNAATSLEILIIPPSKEKEDQRREQEESGEGGDGGGDVTLTETSTGRGWSKQLLSDLFPSHFGPDDLLPNDIPLMLEACNNCLQLINEGDKVFDPDIRRVAGAALIAANVSYAPYSRSPSGLALMTRRGTIYSGSYMESAAYNPSLSPLQAALIALITGRSVNKGTIDSQRSMKEEEEEEKEKGGGGYPEEESKEHVEDEEEDYSDIICAVVVEKIGRDGVLPPVRQYQTIRIALQYIAPKATLYSYGALERDE